MNINGSNFSIMTSSLSSKSFNPFKNMMGKLLGGSSGGSLNTSSIISNLPRGVQLCFNEKYGEKPDFSLGVELVQPRPGIWCPNDSRFINNVMKNYDEDGDLICPITGLAGLDATNKDPAEINRIINVPDDAKQKLFEHLKTAFTYSHTGNNGVITWPDSAATRGSEIYREYQASVPKQDRLPGTYTLGKFMDACDNYFKDAIKASNPNWKYGDAYDLNVVESINWENVKDIHYDENSWKSVDCWA